MSQTEEVIGRVLKAHEVAIKHAVLKQEFRRL
jgi:hypothetical protein